MQSKPVAPAGQIIWNPVLAAGVVGITCGFVRPVAAQLATVVVVDEVVVVVEDDVVVEEVVVVVVVVVTEVQFIWYTSTPQLTVAALEVKLKDAALWAYEGVHAYEVLVPPLRVRYMLLVEFLILR
jgi:hypothetical protein